MPECADHALSDAIRDLIVAVDSLRDELRQARRTAILGALLVGISTLALQLSSIECLSSLGEPLFALRNQLLESSAFCNVGFALG